MEESEKAGGDNLQDGIRNKAKRVSFDRDGKASLLLCGNNSKKRMSTNANETIERDASKKSKLNLTRNVMYFLNNYSVV